jgi:glycerophosphoryl diester phosphodiesterase
MRKSLLNFFLVFTAIVTVSGCGSSTGTVQPLTDVNQDYSSESFFNNTSADYPKVHPKYYNKKYPVTVIAHRGYRDVAPENTLSAFRKAVQLGADMVELDVHLSKDGQVVVMHDDTLDRTTNGTGPVENKTLAELKLLDAGAFFSPVFKGEPIPTLEEVLQFAKDKISVNIEIKKEAVEKQSQAGIEKKVVDLMVNSGMQEYLMVSSFSAVAITRIKQINPSISTGYLMVSDGLFSSQVSRVAKVKADAVHEMGPFVSKNDVVKSHEHDIEENTWTINDPHKMSELINKGVDGLITDRPDLAIRVLEEKYPSSPLGK